VLVPRIHAPRDRQGRREARLRPAAPWRGGVVRAVEH
jgi:hypothetical protein